MGPSEQSRVGSVDHARVRKRAKSKDGFNDASFVKIGLIETELGTKPYFCFI